MALPVTRTLSLLLALGLAPACGPATPKLGPHEALRRYIAAVKRDRPAEAYALLDERLRRRYTRDQFIGKWKRVRRELAQQAAALERRLASKPVATRADVLYPSGVQATLVAPRSERWSIVGGPSLSMHTPSPIHALRAFVLALEQRNLEAVLQLMTPEVRKRLTEWSKHLGAAVGTKEISITGNEATLRFGEGAYVKLKRTKGQWRIVDFGGASGRPGID